MPSARYKLSQLESEMTYISMNRVNVVRKLLKFYLDEIESIQDNFNIILESKRNRLKNFRIAKKVYYK